MAKKVILTKTFWADMLERCSFTAAQAVVAVMGADQAFPNAFTLDYRALAGVAAGGFLAALVKGVAKLGFTAPVSTVYVSRDPSEEEIQQYLAKRSGGDVEKTPFPEYAGADPAGN